MLLSFFVAMNKMCALFFYDDEKIHFIFFCDDKKFRPKFTFFTNPHFL